MPDITPEKTPQAVGAQQDWRAALPPALQQALAGLSLEQVAQAYLERPGCDVADANAYRLQVPAELEGLYDADMAQVMKQVMFAAGLSQAQAEAIHQGYLELAADAVAQQQADAQVEAQALDAEIQRVWGAKGEIKRAAAQRAAQFIGLDAQELAGLAAQVDAMRLLDALARMGEALDEDSLTPGNQAQAMTPAQAQAELARLAADKQHLNAFLNPAHPQHQQAKQQRAHLAMIQATTLVGRG